MSDQTKQINRPSLAMLAAQEKASPKDLPTPGDTPQAHARTTITRGSMRLDEVEAPKDSTMMGLKRNFSPDAIANARAQAADALTIATPKHDIETAGQTLIMPGAPPRAEPPSQEIALDQTIDLRNQTPQDDSLAKTLLSSSSPTHQDTDLNMTATISEASSPMLEAPLTKKTTIRTTSLPRVQVEMNRPSLNFDERERYHKVKPLGQGGMGDVLLVNDEDINRKVAMKRLKHNDQHALVRFIDEIQTIGRLEHPNIIPIHDVGVDQDGSYFFIMKHVEGETLEDIIDKLAAGDPEYHAKYTYDVRIQIFLDVLHAIDFAHSRDIIHRDIKPSNIMVGPHGEVIVMDWGLAKSLKEPSLEEPSQSPIDLASTLPPDFFKAIGTLPPRQRLRLTQHGELLGTPAYMSPEQAKGEVDLIDKRTDTYALSVLFHELMTLRHYLEGKDNLISMLHGVMHDQLSPMEIIGQSVDKNPSPVPAEVGHYISRGLKKDPQARFEDAAQMLSALQRVIDGTFAIEFAVTFLKRRNRDLSRMIDKNPKLVMYALTFFIASFLGMIVITTVSLIT